MTNSTREPSGEEIERMFAGLEADLADPSRLRLEQIDREIADLRHRKQYSAESYEVSHINDQIKWLEAEKQQLTGGIEEAA